MLTFTFLLILHFTGMGGGGTVQTQVKATSLKMCEAARHMAMSSLPDLNGWAGDCKPLVPPEPIAKEEN
jgi:hypothetical protein